MSWIAWPAAPLTGVAALVLVWGTVAAARSRARAGAVFAAHTALALDFLLAAGIVRLAAVESLRQLGTVAAIIVVRKVVTHGIRAGARASAAPAPRPG